LFHQAKFFRNRPNAAPLPGFARNGDRGLLQQKDITL